MAMQNLELGIRPSEALRAFVPSCRRAFSLVEIMFAVMILGIGFIMIAAMFPVAIQQSQATVTETTGTIVAESSMRTLKALPAAWYVPGPSPTDWAPVYLGSQQISASDPQFGYVAFARQSPTLGPGNHDLLTITVQARNTPGFPLPPPTYSLVSPYYYPYDLRPATGASPCHTCTVTAVKAYKNDIGSITFAAGAAGQAVEGAYLLINDLMPPNYYYREVVIQLGTQTGPNTWQVLPLPPTSSIPSGTAGIGPAFIIGRGLSDPTQPYNAGTNPYTGPCIAVQASSIVTVNK